MKVNHVTERTAESQGNSLLDSDEMDRAGIDLGATGRLQLMAKLAEGKHRQTLPIKVRTKIEFPVLTFCKGASHE